MGIPGVSGFMKRLGKIGKFGLVLLVLGLVLSIFMSSATNPAEYTQEPRINGRTVVPSENLINQPIGFIQMQVFVEPDLDGVPYSIGIVPSFLTSSVQDEADLENNAVAYELNIQGSVEISHSQLGGAERFDIVILSQRSISLKLDVTYNIAFGTFTTPILLIGLILMALGFGLGYIQDRRIRAPFMDPYAPDGHGKPESSSSHYVDSGMTDSAKMEQTTSNFSAQTTSSSTAVEGEKCPYCGGGPITASDIFCPSCFTEV